MTSGPHNLKSKAFRPEPDEYTSAMDVLGDRQMDDFLRACLRALRENPEAFLATLAPHWPPPRPRGRPRKAEPPTP
ncbi:MAG: hypothetical protein ACRDXB_02295 [Actinomycetes bacterium]